MTPRRAFLHTAAAAAAASLWLRPASAFAQGASNIVELGGDVLVNGRRAAPDDAIQPGDRIQTAPGGTLGFTLGRDAFLVRPGSDLTLVRGASLFIVGGVRLVSGGLLSVFGRSARARQVVTPTVTAGIRGTGFYVEARAGSTYFCTCFGVIDLAAAGGQRETVTAERHQARLVSAAPAGAIAVAPFENHDDAELLRLARLVGQRPAGYAR
ncbi:MAG: iron dicitrate transport regulator FecR [Burkholderiales bacterium]|nr:iron dicitrate transport regulator FecR [Burkholderiales bacterium]